MSKKVMVKNVNKLPLEKAWKNWVDCLKGDDTNSIFHQIELMIWDTAILRIILESRQIHIEKNPGAPAINGFYHSFIDRIYFHSQVSCIRRLTDKSSELTGERGVYSIPSFLEDMRKYRIELTREKYFKLRDMPYDYTDIQNKKKDFMRNQRVRSFFVPPELNWERIEETHQTYDRLSNTNQKNRQPDDVIAERVFSRLLDKLADCKDITKYVDKYVAHSATPESRTTENIADSEFTLNHLWEAHQIIFEVAEFLSTVLFSEGHMALPIENPNFFQYWEIPLVENIEIDHISNALGKYRKETETWTIKGIDNIWQWIET